MAGDKIRYSGTIGAAEGYGFFKVNVQLPMGIHEVMCQLSGKMRMNNIKIATGDNVEIEIDAYNMKKGRILYRNR